MNVTLAVLLILGAPTAETPSLRIHHPELPKSLELMAPDPDDRGPFVATSRHYHVASDVSQDVSDWTARFLERLWPALTERFGRPARAAGDDGRFRVFIHRTRAGYEHTTMRENPRMREVDRTCGNCSYRTGRVRVLFDPFPVHFRRILIHEVGHQFHYHSIGSGRGEFRRTPFWYIEGVAYELERHTDGGSAIRIAREGSPYFTDFPARAVRYMERPGFRLIPFLRCDSGSWPRDSYVNYALGWSVVRFFRHAHGGRYRRWYDTWETILSESGWPETRRHLRKIDEEEVLRELIAYTKARIPGERARKGEWTSDGSGGYVAHYAPDWYDVLPVCKAPPPNRTASVSFDLSRPLRPEEGVGVLIGLHGTLEYTVAQITSGGSQLYFVTRNGTRFENAVWYKLPERVAHGRFELHLAGNVLTVQVGDTPPVRHVMPGRAKGGPLALFAEQRAPDGPGPGPVVPIRYRFANVTVETGAGGR